MSYYNKSFASKKSLRFSDSNNSSVFNDTRSSDKKSRCTCGSRTGPCSDGNIDMLIVSGTERDQENLVHEDDMTETVWLGSKPPSGFGQTPPIVSSRRTAITRAHLDGKIKMYRPKQPVSNRKSMSIVYRSASKSETIIY